MQISAIGLRSRIVYFVIDVEALLALLMPHIPNPMSPSQYDLPSIMGWVILTRSLD